MSKELTKRVDELEAVVRSAQDTAKRLHDEKDALIADLTERVERLETKPPEPVAPEPEAHKGKRKSRHPKAPDDE